MEDRYQIITSRSEGEYKEKGSKFLAYAFPVKNESDVQSALQEIVNIHPKSRHNCYAYRIGLGGTVYRANDDGEPSGTAGKPILGQLLSHGVSDAFVVVVRYFGGTKLGASGLINAYKTAANDALSKCQKDLYIIKDLYLISFEYESMGKVMNDIKSLDFEIIEKQFEATAKIIVAIPRTEVSQKIINLKAALLKITNEEITNETIVDFCRIEKLNS